MPYLAFELIETVGIIAFDYGKGWLECLDLSGVVITLGKEP